MNSWSRLGLRHLVWHTCLVAVGCADANGAAGQHVRFDAGVPTPLAEVGPNGGYLPRLLFACIGDTRPPTEDDLSGYPTPVITRIFADIEAMKPRPAVVFSTGDYVFASGRSGNGSAAAQFDLYLLARQSYSGVLFPAMGNHECTGATNSNCGPDSVSGMSANYVAFLEKMLSPIRKREPYYSVRIDALDRSWTAKFVVIAANAWSFVQEKWLDAELAKPTTYTFVVRHEPAAATTAPGVVPSEAVMARHPFTLSIVGHRHTYDHFADTPREVIIGNGGAPLASKDYGFGVFKQRSDGAIAVDMVNWATGEVDPDFHFAVTPDGRVVL
jgi:hypothetical protein